VEYLVIIVAALAASSLAFFSGFGLGALLLPAFIFFLPVHVAVAATATVHLATSIFRVALEGRRLDWRAARRFGLAAVPAAVFGAWVLGRLAHMPVWLRYAIDGRSFEVTPVKVAIGVFILVFAVMDLLPGTRRYSLPPRYLPVGGLVSGFLGGFSGHQGALKAAFLLRAGLAAEALIVTSALITVGVDLGRLVVYGTDFYRDSFTIITPHAWTTVAAAVGAAIVGSMLGQRYLKAITIASLRAGVGVLLVLSGAALTAGLL
jgi:uncharacterized membrane protein YfcA